MANGFLIDVSCDAAHTLSLPRLGRAPMDSLIMNRVSAALTPASASALPLGVRSDGHVGPFRNNLPGVLAFRMHRPRRSSRRSARAAVSDLRVPRTTHSCQPTFDCSLPSVPRKCRKYGGSRVVAHPPASKTRPDSTQKSGTDARLQENRLAPHSALGFLSPKEFRAQQFTELRV